MILQFSFDTVATNQLIFVLLKIKNLNCIAFGCFNLPFHEANWLYLGIYLGNVFFRQEPRSEKLILRENISKAIYCAWWPDASFWKPLGNPVLMDTWMEAIHWSDVSFCCDVLNFELFSKHSFWRAKLWTNLFLKIIHRPQPFLGTWLGASMLGSPCQDFFPLAMGDVLCFLVAGFSTLTQIVISGWWDMIIWPGQ